MDEKCFGMGKAGTCCVLSTERCPGCGRCGFYKSRSQYQNGLELAHKRLCALPLAQQEYIAEKYHGGQMPWKGRRV